MAKNTLALVLCDVPAHGLKAGNLLEADAALVKALVAEGLADPHKDAVAAATARGADKVRSTLELAAERLAAEAAAVRAEIEQLEALVAKPDADDAAKNAAAARIVELRAQLPLSGS